MLIRKEFLLIVVFLSNCLILLSTVSSGTPPQTGSLSYLSEKSSPMTGIAVFEIALSFPENPSIIDVNITVKNNLSENVFNFTVNWTHIVSDIQHVRGGDRLTIDVPNTNISGYEVIISFKGYSGTISGIVPGDYQSPIVTPTPRTSDMRILIIVMVVLLVIITYFLYRRIHKRRQ